MSTHNHFCNDPTCNGIISWDQLPDETFQVSETSCVIANEFNAARQDIKYGIRIVDSPEKLQPYEVPNMFPTSFEEEVAFKDIQHEHKEGWLRIVTTTCKFVTGMFSKEEPSKFRIIKNYSSPKNKSINDAITDRHTTMMSVRTAIPMMNPFCWMAKVDCTSAFRMLPIHPDHLQYTNYKIRDTYYNDLRCTWGLKCSMFYFQRYTMLARLIMIAEGHKNVLVYVDDFLTIENSEADCKSSWIALQTILESLGFEISQKEDKLVPPTRKIKFLGLWLNSNSNTKGQCTITVDPEKLKSVQDTMKQLLHQNKHRPGTITKNQLDCLCGSLVHISQTAFAARSYYRHLLSCKNDPKISGVLTKAAVSDSYYWLNKFNKYDGKSIVVQRPQLSSTYWATDAMLDKDAAGQPTHAGIGSFYDGEIISVQGNVKEFRSKLTESANPLQQKHSKLFPMMTNPKYKHTNTIQYLELFAFFWSLAYDPQRLRNTHIPIRVDNQNACTWLYKGTTPVSYTPLLRAILNILFEYNITLYPVWVASKSNELADLASRGEARKLQQLKGTWQNMVSMVEKFTPAKHLYPTPLFLFGKGYLDGRYVHAWWSDEIDIVSVPGNYNND